MQSPYRFLTGVAATMLAAEKANADYAIFLVHELFDSPARAGSYSTEKDNTYASLQEKELAAFTGHRVLPVKYFFLV